VAKAFCVVLASQQLIFFKIIHRDAAPANRRKAEAAIARRNGRMVGFPRPSNYVNNRPTCRGLPSGNRRPDVLNRLDRPSPMAGEAEVKYLDGDFRIIRPGAFVRCAVTGAPIPLEELKYWSVDLQEAYAGPEAVLKRFLQGSVCSDR